MKKDINYNKDDVVIEKTVLKSIKKQSDVKEESRLSSELLNNLDKLHDGMKTPTTLVISLMFMLDTFDNPNKTLTYKRYLDYRDPKAPLKYLKLLEKFLQKKGIQVLHKSPFTLAVCCFINKFVIANSRLSIDAKNWLVQEVNGLGLKFELKSDSTMNYENDDDLFWGHDLKDYIENLNVLAGSNGIQSKLNFSYE
ncbi:MAG: hypothetical protein GY730_00210 [bacterium]|nr:hypothetical protein [bacterium]